MVDKSKLLDRNSVRSSTKSFRRVSLTRAIELLITLFYKKPSQEQLAHVKKWEREKIIHLGLTAHTPRQICPAKKDIYFTSWDREKVTNFGLAESHSYKKISRDHVYPKQNPIDTDIKSKRFPKNNPPQLMKKAQQPVRFKKDNALDDFFKVLGYE